MALRRSAFAFFSTLFFVCLLAGTSFAQDYDAAGRHFAAGQDSFAQQRFHVAALHFQAAYDITQDPVLLFNIAESYENAGDAKRAVDGYRAYLAAKPTAQDRPDVDKRIARLESKKPPLVDKSVDGDKAEADKIVAAGAVAPLPPAATEVPVTAAVPSTEPAVVAPVTPPPVQMAPAPAAGTTTAPMQVGLLEEHPATRLRVAAWSGVAATLALLTTGAILGLAAQSRGDEVSRRLAFSDSTGQPLQFDTAAKNDFKNLRDEGKLYNGLAAGFYTGAAAMAVVTTTLFLVDWHRNKLSKKNPALEHAMNRLMIAPSAAQGSAGLVAGGSF